ncbi:translocation protein S66 [Tulasnella sp. 403]|nr:translocation protein S66 [Tulasnella sp. 403]
MSESTTPPKATISILVPVTYIALLIGSLLIFSRVYKKRLATRLASQEQWFPTHPARDTYISLLQLSPPPSDTLLKAALFNRAIADVQRILSFREHKTALQTLLQKGSISDSTFSTFTSAEKELEAEILDVVNEANSFHSSWGAFIFQSASEVVNNMKNRQIYEGIGKMKTEAEHKYGVKSSFKPSTTPLPLPALGIPSPAPASPKLKNAAPRASTPSRTPTPSTSTGLGSSYVGVSNATASGSSSPAPSANGDAVSVTSSPTTKTTKLGGGKKRQKRK